MRHTYTCSNLLLVLALKISHARIIISHYRHVHTDYKRARKLLRRKRLPPDFKQQMVKDLKARYTEEVRRLAIKDCLLKE